MLYPGLWWFEYGAELRGIESQSEARPMTGSQATAQADAPSGWRARLTDWWHGRTGGRDSQRLTRRLGRPAMPQAALSQADRERILGIEAPQYVWGPLRVGPGTPAFYEKLMTTVNPSADETLLVVGAGLGGPSRMLHDRFGARIDGLETSPAVVAQAKAVLESADLADAIRLKPFNPEGTKLPDRAYDCALMEPMLYGIQNKLELLREIDLALKPTGQLVLLDYVVGGLNEHWADAWREWTDSERPSPKVRTSGEMKELFRKAKLKVRASNDITPIYAQMITRTWAGCLDRLEHRSKAEQQTDPVLRGVAELAEIWARRVALMEVGALKVVRYQLAKSKFGK